jgi:cobalamin biosynthesis protein CobW
MASPVSAAARVPVLVVSGFLGSGKTTLVRHLLDDARARGERVAVVSNEFGELGIDRAILGSGGQAYVELEGGCVCCQLTDALVETLEMLRREVDPQRVLIETSGVALPYDTQLNLYREPVASWVGDDLSVVVVNAEQLAARRELEGTFADQVASADFLILNKLDLVAPAQIGALEAALRDYEPEAPILRSVRCRLDARLLFVPPVDAGLEAQRERAAQRASHGHEQFEVDELRVPADVELEALARQVAELDALRAKGFVRTRAGVRLVQRVGPRLELLEVEGEVAPELLGRVVVIRRAGGAVQLHA